MIVIYGKNPVLELIKAKPQKIKTIYYSFNVSDSKNQLLKEALDGIDCKKRSLSAKDLTDLVAKSFAEGHQRADNQQVNKDGLGEKNQIIHQGIAAELKERIIFDLDDYLKHKLKGQAKAFFLILDSIYDPHNFGAILRSAECYGVTAVLFSAKHSAKISPVVSKSSVGALDLVDLISIGNVSQAIKKLKDNGFWLVASAISDKSVSANDFEYPDKTAFVLGSEGRGVKPIIQKNSDFLVHLPMYGQIDSLNVSQASAVFLNLWKQKETSS